MESPDYQTISLDALLEQFKIDLPFRFGLQDEAPRIAPLRYVLTNIESNNTRESHSLTTCRRACNHSSGRSCSLVP